MSCEAPSQGRFDFPDCYEGGSLRSFDIAIAVDNSAALSAASIAFKAAGSDTASLTLTNGDGLTLTSTTAGAWVITVDQIDTIGLAKGTYFYSLRTTDADDVVEDFIAGTWTIKNT